METDACDAGIGAVLQQEGHPIAFISKALAPKHLGMSVYEKELLAIVYAVKKWHHYLCFKKFLIKIDHKSLKYMMEQRITATQQQKYMAKLFRYDFEITYKQGKDNIVADELSKLPAAEVTASTVSTPVRSLLPEIEASLKVDNELKNLIQELELGQKRGLYCWQDGLLRRKGKLVVGKDQELKNKLVALMHETLAGGHSGVQATVKRLQLTFLWKGMEKDVRNLLRNCVICQKCKYDANKPAGLIQPLPIPEGVWTDLSMGFIEGLPKSSAKEVILVAVDRLTKYAHFISLSHPYTALDVAVLFLNNVSKLYGLPTTIVSDRDPIFVSNFWRELFKLQGVELLRSSAYHPQMDGQTEVVNRSLETYIRCMTHGNLRRWNNWLPLAEWWYNTNYHTSLTITPFEALYGIPPPLHIPYVPGDSKIESVNQLLRDREEALQVLKQQLTRAQ